MIKKFIAMILVGLMTFTFVTGCSNESKKSSGEEVKTNTSATTTESASKESQETLEYTLFAHNWQLYDGQESDRVLKEIEKKFNVKLKLSGAPWEGWTEKLNLKINTGEIPDIFFYLPWQAEYTKWAQSGILQDYDAYLDKTTYLKKLFNTPEYKNLVINNKHYFMPLLAVPSNHNIYVRRDWLNNLGLKDPTNIEEFEAMLVEFTKNDPDKNGKDDTVGMTASNIQGWLQMIHANFGTVPGWVKNSNGEYEYSLMMQPYKDFLVWFSKMYKEGNVKKEFFLNNDARKEEEFIAGNAGVMIANGGPMLEQIVEVMKANDPKQIVDVLPPPAGPAGEGRQFHFGGFWGGWSLSAKIKDPERAVKMLDYTISPEGNKLLEYGVEGVHYTMEGDKIVPNLEERLKEGEGKFQIVDQKPIGIYGIGQYFGNGIISFEGDKVLIKPDRSFNKNKDLLIKADEMSMKKLVLADTLNVLNFADGYAEISKKLTDVIEKYTVMIVSGQKDIEKGWEEMAKEADSIGYKKAQQLVKETMTSLK